MGTKGDEKGGQVK